ncbi:MAG TPA: DUF4229 domain-containing protein [Arthrobacter sp.]|nr:DUF4229 domain-containing protein [Arthrobacter sp.]
MAFFKYTAVRLGITAAVLVLCLWLGLGWIFSAIVAVIIAFCISFLFLTKMRDEAAASIQYRFSGSAPPLRTATERKDADAEDSFSEANPDYRPKAPPRGRD